MKIAAPVGRQPLFPVSCIARRPAQLPNVPAVAQTLPGYDVTSFAGIAAPGGTPEAVVAQLNRELHAVLALPEVCRRFTESGGNGRPGMPGKMADHLSRS